MFQSCTDFFLYGIAFPPSISWHFSLSLWVLDANKILDPGSFRITWLLLKTFLYSLYGFFAQSVQQIHSKPVKIMVIVEGELRVKEN